MKNLTVSKISMRMAVLALLAVFSLMGCGGGGGGNNNSTGPTQTITSTVGSNGGALSPTNETTVTFDAGVVQDGTSVKVTLSDAPSSTSTQIQPASQVLRIELSPDAVSQAITDETKGISIQIPLDQSVISSAPAMKALSAAGTSSNTYSYIKAKANDITFYGSYVTQTIEGKVVATAKLGAEQLSIYKKKAKEELVDLLTIEAIVEFVQPNVPTAGQLFEVKETTNGAFDFITPSGSIGNGKLPLVLIHGIQVGCDGNKEAYKETWKAFITFFYGNEDLKSKFQLYTYSYRTDTSIKLNGSLFAQALQSTFGNTSVAVVAHSMGGLVTRSAVVHDNANIGGVITLGTPHHGTFITNDVAGYIDQNFCIGATSAQGAKDLAWDNFDKSSAGCGNPFLCDPSVGLNNQNDNFQNYIPYAGVVPFNFIGGGQCVETNPLDVIWYWSCNAGVEEHWALGYKSDGAVPEISARFQDYNNGQYQDKTTFRRTPRSYENKDHVSIHDQATVFPDIAYDLKGFYDSLTVTIPSDTTPPIISSTSPVSNATSVAVDSPITATFSEAMDTSTINTATFMLDNGSSNVAGVVTYGGTTATFTPSSNLAYSTTYTATITTAVKDAAGTAMAAAYTWTFTTASAPGSAPTAPTGINATAVNGQATISWSSVSGATSYNIYWSTLSGVTKTSGTKISNVTSPYTHTGRTNGTTYYYVVTAVNSVGESAESSQASATPTSGATVIAIAAGGVHSLALKSDGTVWAWGVNQNGQLGDGTTTNRYIPVQVDLGGVTAIASGGSHSLALKNDGTVLAWGGNSAGQLGDGTTTNRYTPVQVGGLSGVVAIAGGGSHSIALKNDGTVWVWGYNAVGQVGDGTTTDRYTPVQVSGFTGITAIAGGNAHTIALKNDGSVWAWGANDYRQLGDGTYINRYTPVQVIIITNIIAIEGGQVHTSALKDDGTVWSWSTNFSKPDPSLVDGFTGIAAIAEGSIHIIALKNDTSVWAWGSNGSGQLGNGSTSDSLTAVQVSGLTGITAIAGGGYHTMALKNDGTVWVWGDNSLGQLGDGTTTNRTTPVQVGGL